MSEYDDYEDDPYEQEPEKDSNPVKTLRKRGDDLARKLKEAEERNAELSARLRTTDVQDALKDAGIANFDKVANLVPASITPDKVGEWLKEYGELFGAQAKPEAAQEAAPPAVDPAVQQQMNAMQTLSTGASAPSGQITEADIKAAPSKEELLKLLGVQQ